MSEFRVNTLILWLLTITVPVMALSDGAVQGKPGPDYWQQQVSYDITAQLSIEEQTIQGEMILTYRNNSPHELAAIWIVADETGLLSGSPAVETALVRTSPDGTPVLSEYEMGSRFAAAAAGAGLRVHSITDRRGRALPYIERDQFLRVQLPAPLAPGKATELGLTWSITLGDMGHSQMRGGFDYSPQTDTYQFFVGHWYPRVALFRPNTGWYTKPFLGAGEFAAEFADFDVSITVPANHTLAATGELQNARAVLTETQRERLQAARVSNQPVIIVTEDEARTLTRQKKLTTRTWRFTAEKVRDFAWASSPRFVWDAAAYSNGGTSTLLMSMYPYDAAALWSSVSTPALAHTLDVYQRFTLPYPYPVLQSVNAYSFPTGIEYPMLGFSGPRPAYDHTTGESQFPDTARQVLAELIIHEAGHNYFPMIVNSNEREFAWMDEGLNTLINHLAALEWSDEPGVLFGRNLQAAFSRALIAEPRVSLMTPVDDMPNWFANSYFKAAGALLLLREEVLGAEQFDAALRTYTQRWAFRHPSSTDFFRTFEDISGASLEWFWQGWFYSDDYFDLGIRDVFRFDQPAGSEVSGTWHGQQTAAALIELPYRYVVVLNNTGGLLMPVTLRMILENGEQLDQTVPVTLWRQDNERALVRIAAPHPIKDLHLDPNNRLPDANPADNRFSGQFKTREILPMPPRR